MLSNQRGSVLVTVLVVAVTVLILGSTLMSMAISDQKQTLRQHKNTEAFYLARSGAEAIAHYLLNNPERVDDLVAIGEDEVQVGNGRVVVRVSKGTETVMIHSTGHVGNYSESISLSLLYGSSGVGLILNEAVYAYEQIHLAHNHSKIVGDVATYNGSLRFNSSSSTIDGYVFWGDGAEVVGHTMGKIEGFKTLEEERIYPLPVFPDFPTLGGRKTSTPNRIVSDGWYSKIDKSLTIDVGDGVREVRVDELNLSNNTVIRVAGTGRLILYVDKITRIGNNSKIGHEDIINNFNSNKESIDSITMYYKGSDTLEFGNGSAFYLNMYAKVADIKAGNNSGVFGSIFSGGSLIQIDNNAEARLIYAPYASVHVSNNAEIEGAVICNNLVLDYAPITWNPVVREKWKIVFPHVDFDPDDFAPGGTELRRGYWSN